MLFHHQFKKRKIRTIFFEITYFFGFNLDQKNLKSFGQHIIIIYNHLYFKLDCHYQKQSFILLHKTIDTNL